jgi:hypothetical protein
MLKGTLRYSYDIRVLSPHFSDDCSSADAALKPYEWGATEVGVGERCRRLRTRPKCLYFIHPFKRIIK